MTKSEAIIEEGKKYLAGNYNPLPFVTASGSGVWIYDADDKEYLDMLSCYSANNFGNCNDDLVNALMEQIRKLAISPRCFWNDKLVEFAKKITGFCGMDRILVKNTGAEAVESAILIARKFGYEHKEGGVEEGRAEIITCIDNFHGRTLGPRSMSTTYQYRHLFGPLGQGFSWVPFGDSSALVKAINKNTVAFFVEPILGEGGIIVPPDGYLREVETICRQHNILLVVDEIQTGFGRTGYDFAYQYENVRPDLLKVKPDLLIVAKALGGGILGISGVLGRDDVMSVIKPGDDGSTLGGNPLACAVAIEAIEILEREGLSEKARNLGDYFISRLKEIESPLIKEVRGRGLMIGIELVKEAGGARQFCEQLGHEGVLCYYTHEHVLRLSPPLTIKKIHLDWCLEKIRKVLRRP